MKDAHTGWYLVFTKANQETIATMNLERQGFDTYFPLLQQHKRRRNIYQAVSEPLFPRYLFVHLNAETDDWSKIRSTRGCLSLVKFGTFPARVPDKLIEQLKLHESDRVLQNNASTPEFKPGDHVKIIDGVLSNYKGIVALKNSQERITILLTITENHTCRVNVSIHQVMGAN